MVVFSLARNEAVVVGGDIVVRVLEVRGDTVEIVIEHPEADCGEYEAPEQVGCEPEPVP
jgi:hypothetical protein